MRVADQLIANGPFDPRTWASPLPIPPTSRPGSAFDGLYVQAVSAGGPGAAAGLQVGDVITTVDGHGERAGRPGPGDGDQAAGRPARIDYVRDGRAGRTELTLAAQP